MKMPWNFPANRCCCGGYRKELPPDHPLRTASIVWPDAEIRPGSLQRTHAGTAENGMVAEHYQGYKKYHPEKRVGINRWCPLAILHLFDVVWDFLPDMMHIIDGTMSSHIIPMLKGKRNPAAPKFTGKSRFGRIYTQADLAAQKKAWNVMDARRKVIDKV